MRHYPERRGGSITAPASMSGAKSIPKASSPSGPWTHFLSLSAWKLPMTTVFEPLPVVIQPP